MTIDEALENLDSLFKIHDFGLAEDIAQESYAVLQGHLRGTYKPPVYYWATHDEGEMFWANEKKGY